MRYVKFTFEESQSWYVNRLHRLIKKLENEDTDEARENIKQVNEVLHLMVHDGLSFMDACKRARG